MLKPTSGYRSRRVHGFAMAQRWARLLTDFTLVALKRALRLCASRLSMSLTPVSAEKRCLRSSCPALRAASFGAGLRVC